MIKWRNAIFRNQTSRNHQKFKLYTPSSVLPESPTHSWCTTYAKYSLWNSRTGDEFELRSQQTKVDGPPKVVFLPRMLHHLHDQLDYSSIECTSPRKFMKHAALVILCMLLCQPPLVSPFNDRSDMNIEVPKEMTLDIYLNVDKF